MCEALERWGKRERKEGMEEGIKEGVRALVNTCKEFRISKEEARERILKNFNLDAQVAEKYLNEFWM